MTGRMQRQLAALRTLLDSAGLLTQVAYLAIQVSTMRLCAVCAEAGSGVARWRFTARRSWFYRWGRCSRS